jgi:hypothetical protein
VTKKPPAGCWWPRKVPPLTPARLPAGCHALVFLPKAPTLVPSAAWASHLRPGLTRRVGPLPTSGRATIFYRPIRHGSPTPTARGRPCPYRPGSALVYTLPRHCQPRQIPSVPPALRLYIPSNNPCQRSASTFAKPIDGIARPPAGFFPVAADPGSQWRPPRPAKP